MQRTLNTFLLLHLNKMVATVAVIIVIEFCPTGTQMWASALTCQGLSEQVRQRVSETTRLLDPVTLVLHWE